jgi:hypothetical protein
MQILIIYSNHLKKSGNGKTGKKSETKRKKKSRVKKRNEMKKFEKRNETKRNKTKRKETKRTKTTFFKPWKNYFNHRVGGINGPFFKVISFQNHSMIFNKILSIA